MKMEKKDLKKIRNKFKTVWLETEESWAISSLIPCFSNIYSSIMIVRVICQDITFFDTINK